MKEELPFKLSTAKFVIELPDLSLHIFESVSSRLNVLVYSNTRSANNDCLASHQNPNMDGTIQYKCNH